MAKSCKIPLTREMMELVAGLATITAAHVMVQLYNRGVFSEGDLEFILDSLGESGGSGDPAIEAMAKAMAETLGKQIQNIRAH